MVQKSFMVSFYLAEQRQYLRLFQENRSRRNGIPFLWLERSPFMFPVPFMMGFRASLNVPPCSYAFKCFCARASSYFSFLFVFRDFIFYYGSSVLGHSDAMPCVL